MAPKPPTLSEQREKVDRLRSELQKPSVMKDPRRAQLLREALEANQRILREQRARQGK